MCWWRTSVPLTSPASEDGEHHVGLAFFLRDDIPGEFGHNGADEGFQALLTMNSETGRGIAIMGNSDAFFRIAPYVHEAVQRVRGWKSTTEPHRPADAVLLALAMRGTQAALDTYERLKQHAIPGYGSPDEGALNQLGYTLLRDRKVDEAIKAFQLNVQEYPQGWNCYDSLAEAYMTAGQKELAIKNGDFICIVSLRGAIETRALVSRRIRPIHLNGKTVHQVALPFHFGTEGPVKGSAANDLFAISGEPNEGIISVHNMGAPIAPDVYHLWPLITQSSPSRTARVRRPVGSAPETSGSVIEKNDRAVPSTSGRRKRSFCSSVPKMCRISPLPASGAWQLKTS